MRWLAEYIRCRKNGTADNCPIFFYHFVSSFIPSSGLCFSIPCCPLIYHDTMVLSMSTNKLLIWWAGLSKRKWPSHLTSTAWAWSPPINPKFSFWSESIIWRNLWTSISVMDYIRLCTSYLSLRFVNNMCAIKLQSMLTNDLNYSIILWTNARIRWEYLVTCIVSFLCPLQRVIAALYLFFY